MTQTANAAPQDLVPGQIIIGLAPSGFYLVQIGRRKYTKRFNLSQTEAADLLDALSEQLSVSR